MKKIVLTLVCIFSISSFVSAKKITVIRKGSDDGVHYERVHEAQSWFWAKLSCLGAGSENCVWLNPPVFDNGVSYSEVENYVLGRIDAGNNSGSVNYNNEVYVEWAFEENGDLTIFMTDEL